MRQVFRADAHERHFRTNGYVVIDLLNDDAVSDLWSFYTESFATRRDVVSYAQSLPYYISVFDKDVAHKRVVDARISGQVEQRLEPLLVDYEVFYSNFMIKFPGDGQIEAHQDFNFVDESIYTAFNLWCPLVDTGLHNGGLCVIPGSHNAFRTQRGPNLPKALTEYNDMLKRYARWLPIRKGQAAIFDHKLIHYSPPNSTDEVRVAIQSVLKPAEATAIHCVFDEGTRKVKAFEIDKRFILETNLWEARLDDRRLDHEQDLIPFPTSNEVVHTLVDLAVQRASSDGHRTTRRVFQNDRQQQTFEENGFVVLPLLGDDEVQGLTALFVESTGGKVENSAYGMYIGLEDTNLERKQALMARISAIVLPRVNEHFADCKPHLGSFLVKAPGENSYTYPHQDWTFVDAPDYFSMTVWIALVDTNETNGALGFVRGSHRFFDRPVGSPSPEFQTCPQGHEALLYQYLDFVPLKAGDAVVFDNRTIHGATPNRTAAPRVAVAVGMTPREAQLYHYFLVPGSLRGTRRTIAKLKVDETFFARHTVSSLKALFDANRMPEDGEIAATLEEEFLPYSAEEIRQLCERSGLRTNGRRLVLTTDGDAGKAAGRHPGEAIGALVGRAWKSLFGPRA